MLADNLIVNQCSCVVWMMQCHHGYESVIKQDEPSLRRNSSAAVTEGSSFSNKRIKLSTEKLKWVTKELMSTKIAIKLRNGEKNEN